MKLQIGISTLAFLALACASSGTQLTANVPVMTQEVLTVCDCESLNVRAGAGTEFPVIDELYIGDEVEYVTETYSTDGARWIVLRLGDGVGYARAKYLCGEK